MILRSIDFSQFKGQSREWRLERCFLQQLNLIVGENATGKSKALNIVNSLAGLLSRNTKLPYMSGDFHARFEKDGQEITYVLRYEDTKVIEEKLLVDGDALLDRGLGGKGKIRATQLNMDIDFQTPENEIAAFAKRDSIQHPFLDDLYSWGENLIHFYFGTQLGKNQLVAFIKDRDRKQEIDQKDTDIVVLKFKDGQKKFKRTFVQSIKRDMQAIGYNIQKIEIGPPIDVTVSRDLPVQPVGIRVKEADLGDVTDQFTISQGMFRAISLIIQLTYAQKCGKTSCVLIDDIGEGLDYDRSSKLISLVIKKAMSSNIQLIMATNDRFVMNNVPLEYWSVIRRIGNRSVAYNYANSKELFEEFELTGLSNFDFFSSHFFLKESKKE